VKVAVIGATGQLRTNLMGALDSQFTAPRRPAAARPQYSVLANRALRAAPLNSPISPALAGV